MVKVNTWSRIINNVCKESLLDHVYTTDPTCLSSFVHLTPFFGDHDMVTFVVNCEINNGDVIFSRDWRNYSKEVLVCELSKIKWDLDYDSVQSFWNYLERNIITTVDKIVPMVPFVNNRAVNKKIPRVIINKINIRKRLLKKIKSNPTIEHRNRIRNLNTEIRNFFKSIKRNEVRRGLIPNNTESIWRSVKKAKDQDCSRLPNVMFKNKIEIPKDDQADVFSCFFDNKIKALLEATNIDQSVYNGKNLTTCANKMFMDRASIRECILSLKVKNNEGFDRIPQRILVDGIDNLLSPLTYLFQLIYKKKYP